MEFGLPTSLMAKALFIHVPKTGGTSIVRAYREVDPDIFAYGGHTPAIVLMDSYVGSFESLWKFAFVRNPWEHAVSWFFFAHKSIIGMPVKILTATTEELGVMFREWLECSGYEHIGRDDRSFHGMLCDRDGELIVDEVYRFENYVVAWDLIRRKLAFPSIEIKHENQNHKRPPIHYSALYDNWSREYVQEAQWWVIQEYQYEFKSDHEN